LRGAGRNRRARPRVDRQLSLETSAAGQRRTGDIMIAKALIGAALALALAAPAASAQDKADQKFLTEAIQGNYAEVEMGKLAQQKGQSEGVKSFGKMLETDHSAANQKAMAAAKQMGMTPPTGPNDKQKADHDKMAKMSGAEFDKMFARDMVADHKKDIKEYEKAAAKKDPAGQYASEALPTLHKHLDTAEKLEQGKSAAK
jgi:putative membrane protein